MLAQVRRLPVYLAVIGAGEADPVLEAHAFAVGQEIARRGGILICGGLQGVMGAAAAGAKAAGGVSIGLLPGPDRRAAHPDLTYALPTNLGHARNIIIAHSAEALIAVGGGYGTISEAAIGLKLGKPVVGVEPLGWHLPGLQLAPDPQAAVTLAYRRLGGRD